MAFDKPRGFIFVCAMVNHIMYEPRRKKACLRGLRATKAQSDQRLCYLIIGNTEYTLFSSYNNRHRLASAAFL